MLDTYELADSSYDSSEWSSDSSYDSYPDDLESNWGEARRKPSPVRPSSGKSAYTPRPSGTGQPVTQAQLQTALAKVSQQITINSGAIKTLDGRVRGVADDQTKLVAQVRKDSENRKKELDGVKRDLQQTREMAALIPIVTAGSSSTLAKLAPLLFLVPADTLSGGSSSSSSSSSSSMLGGSNWLGIAAIALASGAFTL